MKRWLLLCLAVWAGAVAADERLSVCYNYGCAAEAEVRYTESQLAWVRKVMLTAKTPSR